MHITHKKKFERKTYKFCWKNLEKVHHNPYLGMELADDLQWTQHIRNTSRKVNRMLVLLRWNLYEEAISIKKPSRPVHRMSRS